MNDRLRYRLLDILDALKAAAENLLRRNDSE